MWFLVGYNEPSLHRHSLHRHPLYRHSLYRHPLPRHSLHRHPLHRHPLTDIRHVIYVETKCDMASSSKKGLKYRRPWSAPPIFGAHDYLQKTFSSYHVQSCLCYCTVCSGLISFFVRSTRNFRFVLHQKIHRNQGICMCVWMDLLVQNVASLKKTQVNDGQVHSKIFFFEFVAFK